MTNLVVVRAEVAERLLPRCVVYLFGSRARGDWDGFSDTDLLAVAATQELAEKQADHLRAGLVVIGEQLRLKRSC